MKKDHTYKVFHAETSAQTSVISDDNFTYRIVLDVINNYVKSPKRVLDIGCGAGTISLYLASRGNEVVGIDIAENAIVRCNESARLLSLANATFAAMRFPNQIPKKKFDIVICSEVIEHLPHDDLALEKIFSLLVPGGIAIISTPSKNAPMHKMGLAKEFDKRVGHLRRYTLEELVVKCRQAGFTVVATKKTEGLLRNFLFLNPVAGKFVRFIKYFLSDIVTWLDSISLHAFGESQLFVIIRKPL